MDEDKFNMAVRKFLKVVGVTSQRAIDHAVHEAVKAGRLHGNEKLRTKMTLEIGAINLVHEIAGEIEIGSFYQPELAKCPAPVPATRPGLARRMSDLPRV